MRRAILSVLAFAPVVAIAVWLIAGRAPEIAVADVQAVPVDGSQSAMVTLGLNNLGGPDRLIDATSPAAKLTVLKSPRAAGLPVPAGSTPSLSMEAGHIMLMGVDRPLDDGVLIPLTLHFEEAGEIAVKARVSGMAMDHGAEVRVDVPPTLGLTVEPAGDGWRIRLETTGFRFAPDAVDGPHVPGAGHAHLYVEGMKIARLFAPEAMLGALPPGDHIIEVTLATNDHRTYAGPDGPVRAAVSVTVP